ncbi:hypothetical protein B296_00018990 [Ensete ventricosum]|uniref:Secreted protein n=1 Tax=Ensete ventricosum TaxID=4639 RepID=A0A426ZAB9_ENSVE|nr:hypothetical protein B296_00018990 [Ensete ventricosum]
MTNSCLLLLLPSLTEATTFLHLKCLAAGAYLTSIANVFCCSFYVLMPRVKRSSLCRDIKRSIPLQQLHSHFADTLQPKQAALLLPVASDSSSTPRLCNQTRNRLFDFTLDSTYMARLRSRCPPFSWKYSHHWHNSNTGFIERNKVLIPYFSDYSLLNDVVGLIFHSSCRHRLSAPAPLLLSM